VPDEPGVAGSDEGGTSGEGGAAGSDGNLGTGAPLGSSCTQGDTCASSHCSDGVCCDAACSGPCAQCNTSGHCSAPQDDPVCSVVSCSAGTNECLSYDTQIASNRCLSAGVCKTVQDCGSTPKPNQTPCASGVGVCKSGACGAPLFTTFGPSSNVTAISGDGTTVVGSSPSTQSFRWTLATGIVALPLLQTLAFALSPTSVRMASMQLATARLAVRHFRFDGRGPARQSIWVFRVKTTTPSPLQSMLTARLLLVLHPSVAPVVVPSFGRLGQPLRR